MKDLKVAIQFYYVKGRGRPQKTATPPRVNIGPFSSKLICWVLGQICSQFQMLSQLSCLGLSFEVYNSFLGQLAQKLWAVKV